MGRGGGMEVERGNGSEEGEWRWGGEMEVRRGNGRGGGWGG